MEKRLFQTLDEMNVHDTEHGTALVGLCNQVTYIQLSKKGTLVTMGAPKEAIHDIESGKTLPILLLINKEEYEKRK